MAVSEDVRPDRFMKLLKAGRVVIPSNPRHKSLEPRAIGEGTRVKINANIGTSRDFIDVGEELQKVKVAIRYGADAVMDLSTGGNVPEIRRKVVRASTVPVGTVPIYEAACSAAKNGPLSMDSDDLFRTIEAHARDGVDFMTVHC